MRIPLPSFLKRKTTGKEHKALTIFALWRIEVILGAVLLIAILVLDLWVYQTMVQTQNVSLDGAKGLSQPKEKVVRAAAATVRTHQTFLQNPVIPLIQDPF